MRLDERLKLTNGDNSISAWAEIHAQPREGRGGDFTELDDAVTFRVRRTKRVRNFLEDLSRVKIEASRAMPGRLLDVVSVTHSPDREFLRIRCE